MKPYLIHSVLLLSLIGGGWAWAGSEPVVEMLACDGPTCERVAEKVEYRHEKMANTITLNTEHFTAEVPNRPILKIIAGKADLMILYEDGQLLYLSESRGPDIPNLPQDLIYQYPMILFAKTALDEPPEAAEEQLLWKTAIASKPFYFQGATEVAYSENNDLTYYLSDTHELGFSARAMVTNSKFRSVFLVVEAKHMEFKVFKQIVLSVQ